MSAPKLAGYMPIDGQCMCIQEKDGPRCTNRGKYLAQTTFTNDALWCETHTAAIRAEHPEVILSIRSWPRLGDLTVPGGPR